MGKCCPFYSLLYTSRFIRNSCNHLFKKRLTSRWLKWVKFFDSGRLQDNKHFSVITKQGVCFYFIYLYFILLNYPSPSDIYTPTTTYTHTLYTVCLLSVCAYMCVFYVYIYSIYTHIHAHKQIVHSTHLGFEGNQSSSTFSDGSFGA